MNIRINAGSRVTGLALLSLAIACWLSRKAPSASSIVQGMLFYNVAIAALLIYAAAVEKISGIGLWPIVILHLGLAVWCAQSLQKKKLSSPYLHLQVGINQAMTA